MSALAVGSLPSQPGLNCKTRETGLKLSIASGAGGLEALIGSTRETAAYGLFADFEVGCAAGFTCCVALWIGCCFGRGSARDNLDPAALQFTSSVHLFVPNRNCDHVLVCPDGTRCACTLALLPSDDPFGGAPFASSRRFLGILPHFLRSFRPLSELVKCL